MAELQTNIDAMRTALFRAVRLTAAIAVPTSAGIALVADEMASLLPGPKWLPSIPLVRLLCVYAAVRALDTLLPPVLFARHRERFSTLVLSYAIDSSTGCRRCRSAPGRCTRCDNVIDSCILRAYDDNGQRSVGRGRTKFSQLWNEIWPILAGTVVMAVVVLLVHQFAFAERTESALIELVIELVLLSVRCAATYYIVLWATGSPIMGDAVEVADWILRRAAPRAD